MGSIVRVTLKNRIERDFDGDKFSDIHIERAVKGLCLHPQLDCEQCPFGPNIEQTPCLKAKGFTAGNIVSIQRISVKDSLDDKRKLLQLIEANDNTLSLIFDVEKEKASIEARISGLYATLNANNKRIAELISQGDVK